MEIVPLPEAMDGLIDYYRRISGEHPDWDDHRRAMVEQRRVPIRLSIDHVGPDHAGSRKLKPGKPHTTGRLPSQAD